MPVFDKLYRPLTSRPFLSGLSYAEYAPCQALRPYIVCFWGSEQTDSCPAPQRDVLVIPDTCFDIIIKIDHEAQAVTSRLCGLQDYPVTVAQGGEGGTVTGFAVRFHFWAARLFFPFSLREVYNQTVDLELIRPGSAAEFSPLLGLNSMRERIVWMESYLLKRMDFNSYNPDVYNSVEQILKSSGRATVREICDYSAVSQRQMERLFLREVGLPVKRTLSLVRYQSVWREIANSESFDVQDAVYRYGYADQPHLLNEFRRFHGATPEQARAIALKCV